MEKARFLDVLLAMIRAASSLALVGAACAAIPAHEVTVLPGFKGPLPSKHYSGYLPVGKTSGVKGMIHCE